MYSNNIDGYYFGHTSNLLERIGKLNTNKRIEQLIAKGSEHPVWEGHWFCRRHPFGGIQ
ncbi:MAG: hypothetical protein K8R86_02935 [Bacteroidales bacterium]|nr:hypothetical protein [Bacteroidales bacterium]